MGDRVGGVDDEAYDLDARPPGSDAPAGGAGGRGDGAREGAPGTAGPARGPRRRVVVVVVGAALAAVAVVAALTGREEPAPPPLTPTELLAVLASAPDADDALPEVGVEQPAVVPGSTRALGRTDDARYWTGLDARGRVCFLTLVDRTVPGFGASCLAPAEVAARGVMMKITVGGVVSDAVLVPDGYDTRALEAEGLVRTGANLLTRPAAG